MTQTIWTFVLLFAPLPVLLIFGRIRLLRRRRLEENNEPARPRPFEPGSEPSPGFWLRRFPLPERTYLRQQAGAAKIGFSIVVWCVAVVMCSTLLPGGADNPYDWPAGEPALIWNGFVNSAFLLGALTFFFGMVTAVTANFGITAKGPNAMNRTRPVTHGLLYWGRVGTGLLTLLAGCAAGIAISFGLLVALHGPVWQHLSVLDQGSHVTLRQMIRLDSMLNVSAPRLLLSIATSMSMVYSLILFLAQLPDWGLRLPKVFAYLGGPIVYFVFTVFPSSMLPGLSRWLFLYSLSTKIPPPWPAALVPLCISAALLCGGRLLYPRSEA